MSVVSTEIAGYMEKASWIRKMFEAGIQLKQQYGEDAVCDFSLGNPDLPAPIAVADALRELADKADKPFTFGYMPNGGFPWAREALAKWLSGEQGVALTSADVLLSCGAAGALNAFFRAVLEPQDEVLGVSPYFVEYGFYVSNHHGVFKAVPSKGDTFSLDIDAISAAINAKTRAIIINSPNNPTGAIYTEEELKELAALLRAKTAEFGRPIFLIADEPYRQLIFDDAFVPYVLPLYEYSIVVSSFSKNMSLPGERVGYAALAPQMPQKNMLMGALTMTNRILGYVNPPVVGQYMMAKALGQQVDVSIYARRRDMMAKILRDAGYEFTMPKGTFYFFPKAPGGDDVAFCQALMDEKVLGVPGSGFGRPGYFRLTFCVEDKVIARSVEGFAKARAKFA